MCYNKITMKKPSSQKERFYEVLSRAIRKGDKVSSQKRKRKKGGNCNDKSARQCKTEDVCG